MPRPEARLGESEHANEVNHQSKPGIRIMTHWIRMFHNPHSKKFYEVTSDETNLPRLRARLSEQKGDPEWEDESIYVHQYGLDYPCDGEHPDIDVREI